MKPTHRLVAASTISQPVLSFGIRRLVRLLRCGVLLAKNIAKLEVLYSGIPSLTNSPQSTAWGGSTIFGGCSFLTQSLSRRSSGHRPPARTRSMAQYVPLGRSKVLNAVSLAIRQVMNFQLETPAYQTLSVALSSSRARGWTLSRPPQF